jgi:hypothetical protein
MMHVIEFTAHMAPAGHLDQRCVVAGPRWLVELAEAGVAIGMQEASASTEQRFGMFRLAVRPVAVDRGRRRPVPTQCRYSLRESGAICDAGLGVFLPYWAARRDGAASFCRYSIRPTPGSRDRAE